MNDIIMVSATRLSMFLQCKWKYWCNYVLKLPRKPNLSFKLGLAVHGALFLAGQIWQKQEKFTAEDIKRIREEYSSIAAKEGIEDPVIYKDGMDMVMERLKNFVNGKIIAVEERFRVTTDTGVILIGAMDKIEEINNDTLLVTDYKTSKYFETQDELKSDIQLSIYDLVASIKYPKYKRIVLSLDYLRGDPVYTYRTVEERQSFLEYVTVIYNEMLKLEKEDAKPTLNDMCNWCDFTENCTAYQEAVGGKVFIKRKPEDYSDEDLIKEYLDIQSKKRIIDKRERELKNYILRKIESTQKNLIANGKELYPRQRLSTVYDPKLVYENVPLQDFLRMISISKKEADKYFEKNPAAKVIVQENARKSYTSPFIGVKNLKKSK